jgi:CheY-like chemotaxis protein
MAQSEGLGKGSRFIVCLPLADEQQEKTPEAESDLEQQDDSKTLDILLVDDNLDVLDSLQRLLHALGHRVRVCDSGRMVPSFVQERLPDLVLLDLGMPDMDGYQVAKALWKLPQRNEFKVVAVTGYAAEAQQIGEPIGLFDGHLLKPLTLDMLKPYV